MTRLLDGNDPTSRTVVVPTLPNIEAPSVDDNCEVLDDVAATDEAPLFRFMKTPQPERDHWTRLHDALRSGMTVFVHDHRGRVIGRLMPDLRPTREAAADYLIEPLPLMWQGDQA